MKKQLKILIGAMALTLLMAGGFLAYVWKTQQQTSGEPQPTIPGWQAFPASGPEESERITNELYKFSAEAPEGWKAVNPNSSTAGITKEGFTQCKIFSRLTENTEQLSASGWTEKLNPYGTLPPDVKNRFAEEITVSNGLWPAAKVTTFTQLDTKKIEVYIPKGDILFISSMDITAYVDEENNISQDPRSAECEQALNEYVASIRLQ